MKYLLILVLLVVGAVVFFLVTRRSGAPVETDQVAATYVCDECGEHECICHEEDK